ncbi:hypothetical protein [Citrobacter sp. Cpo091]|uniref:hypothetical protein n=1 Tax=Citrobacter sp. Cpo091 TaxID=2985140 RepID=UPI002577FD11|nr:hypothetical protein [Citrobacter sp. Cpo091]MDM2835786.1 hypothetical protein [Citrobacter sp. Cpo091]
MKKIITLTIVAIIAFSWLITHNTAEPEKVPPANVPFIVKSNVPGMCMVSTITTTAGINKNLPNVECKVQTFSVN